jgi:hypothetical protein
MLTMLELPPSRRFSEVSPSPSELAAIRCGRAEIRRGRYVTLEQYLHALDGAPPKASRKTSRQR